MAISTQTPSPQQERREHALSDLDVSLHHQIYLAVRAEILDGLWIGRSDFPGEVGLAKQFNVSVITARAVLNRLVKDGFLLRSRGHKPEVIYSPPDAPHDIDDAGASASVQKIYDYDLIDVAVTTAPWEACQAFGLPPGSALWQCSRVRLYQGKPHSVMLSVQQPETGHRHSLRQLKTLPMPVVLEQSGRPVVRMKRRMSAAIPPPAISCPLGITMQESVLLATMTLVDKEDQPVDWMRIYFHPSRATHLETLDLIP
ncbi:MAG: GntR family transcriptional regulator [Hyphomonadaceae bacterium]